MLRTMVACTKNDELDIVGDSRLSPLAATQSKYYTMTKYHLYMMEMHHSVLIQRSTMAL